MSALSYLLPEGIFAVCVNPIYPIGVINWTEGAVIKFEVLEADAAWLTAHCGEDKIFAFSGHVFRGEIITVESCETTSRLAKPTVRAGIRIQKISSANEFVA